jgi:hypothetical protein
MPHDIDSYYNNLQIRYSQQSTPVFLFRGRLLLNLDEGQAKYLKMFRSLIMTKDYRLEGYISFKKDQLL